MSSVSANKRVAPLKQQTQLPRAEVIDRLLGTFTERYGLTPGAVTAAEQSEAERLAKEKFLSDEWRFLLP